jgi:hypothetical protein
LDFHLSTLTLHSPSAKRKNEAVYSINQGHRRNGCQLTSRLTPMSLRFPFVRFVGFSVFSVW